MRVKALLQTAFIFAVVLHTSSCAYFEQARLSVNHKKIENNVSSSKLVDTTIYFGKAPLSKAYKFNFTNSKNYPFSLIFTVHEGSFSDSNLNHLTGNTSHKNSYSINDEIRVLSALNKNLPKTNQISWSNIDQRNVAEAQEGYALMLEYIRYKVREL